MARAAATRKNGEGAKAIEKRITEAQNAAVAALAPASEQPRGGEDGEDRSGSPRGCSGAGALDTRGLTR